MPFEVLIFQSPTRLLSCVFHLNTVLCLEAERGTLNLSKAVRLLARCLFNEDELVVESIKDLDQHKVDLLHAETARWYNCTMTEVRQGNYHITFIIVMQTTL